VENAVHHQIDLLMLGIRCRLFVSGREESSVSPIEIAWTVVGIAVPVAISLGYTFVGLTPPEFRRARVCFVAGAVVLLGMEIVWYTQTGYSFLWRVIIAILVCLTVGIGLPETLRWVHRRESLGIVRQGVNEPLPTPKAPPVVIPKPPAASQAVPLSSVKTVTKSDGFTILIPIDTQNQSIPIPLDENPDDPHGKFYRTLTFSITNRHPAETSGSLMLQEEQLFSEEGRPGFLGKLIQMYVFDSLFHMSREGYGIELSGGKITPIEDKAVIPPDVVSSPTDHVLAELSRRRLLTQDVELSLKNFPLHMPKGTELTFSEKIEREAAVYVIRMEKPGFFKFDLSVRPMGNSNEGVLPDKFQSQAAKTIKTYSLIVAMESVVQATDENGFEPNKYVTWTQDTFAELRRRMTF
jgi:hypothetical protein